MTLQNNAIYVWETLNIHFRIISMNVLVYWNRQNFRDKPKFYNFPNILESDEFLETCLLKRYWIICLFRFFEWCWLLSFYSLWKRTSFLFRYSITLRTECRSNRLLHWGSRTGPAEWYLYRAETVFNSSGDENQIDTQMNPHLINELR